MQLFCYVKTLYHLHFARKFDEIFANCHSYTQPRIKTLTK